MTPAVTALALMRFARVATSISTRIGYTPQEKAYATRYMLNGINKWAIDSHFDRFWFRSSHRCRSHHHHSGGCGRFRSLFINCDESFVKDIGDVEIIIRLPGGDLVEVGAAGRLVERAF